MNPKVSSRLRNIFSIILLCLTFLSGLIEHHPLPSIHGLFALLFLFLSLSHFIKRINRISQFFQKSQIHRQPFKFSLLISTFLSLSLLACLFTGLIIELVSNSNLIQVHLFIGILMAVLNIIHLYLKILKPNLKRQLNFS
jgi:hypothetical protein